MRLILVRHYNVFFIMSQLRYLFAECSGVLLMTLELRYIFVRSNDVRKLRYNVVMLYCNQKRLKNT